MLIIVEPNLYRQVQRINIHDCFQVGMIPVPPIRRGWREAGWREAERQEGHGEARLVRTERAREKETM